MTNQADLSKRIRTWREFREGATNLFPTESALRWFIRTHEPALLAAGVLIKLRRGVYVDPDPFRAEAMTLMQAAPVGASSLLPFHEAHPARPRLDLAQGGTA